jgi:hypothetical protein
MTEGWYNMYWKPLLYWLQKMQQSDRDKAKVE